MLEFEWDGIVFEFVNCAGGELLEKIAMHSHSKNSFELHFILGGEGTLATAHGSYNMSEGNLFVTGPFEEHSQIPNELNPVEDIYIYFQIKKLVNVGKLAQKFIETPFFYCQHFDRIVAKRIYYEFQNRRVGWKHSVCGLMQALLTDISRLYLPEEYEVKNAEENENLNEKRFMIIEKMFLYEKDFTLSQLSSNLGLCERQTQRLLKKYYGKTFTQKKKETKNSDR